MKLGCQKHSSFELNRRNFAAVGSKLSETSALAVNREQSSVTLRCIIVPESRCAVNISLDTQIDNILTSAYSYLRND